MKPKDLITVGQLQWLSTAVRSGLVADVDYSGMSKEEAFKIIKDADQKFKEALKKK